MIVVSLLRGVNIGGHHKIKMEALRELYAALGLRDPRTFIQSGNVVFRTAARDLPALARRIAGAIEREFGFRPEVFLRTAGELREVAARNPFAARRGIDPARLAVAFLAAAPAPEARAKLIALVTGPEEVQIDGRHLYIWFPNGWARPNLSMAAVERALGAAVTARNWNSVRKLLEIAESCEDGI